MTTIFIILAGILLFMAVGSALFTYSLFWYENAWRVRTLPNGGKGQKLKLFSGFLSSILSMIFLVLTYPSGMLRRLWEPVQTGASGPVIILTHGLYHNASAYLLLRSRLRKAGFNNIFVINYSSFFTSFEETFHKFEEFVAGARRAAPGQPVYLIGHSLGGLFCRVYAERAEGGATPAAVITLGTPHQGSKIVAFALGKLASSLIYRGALFEQLESGPARLPCKGIAFFSPVDNIVFPFEAMEVPYSGWTYYETPPLSHIGMLYSKTTAKKVIEILHGRC